MREFIKLGDKRVEAERIVTYKPNEYDSYILDYFYDGEYKSLTGWRLAYFDNKKERDEALSMLDSIFIKKNEI